MTPNVHHTTLPRGRGGGRACVCEWGRGCSLPLLLPRACSSKALTRRRSFAPPPPASLPRRAQVQSQLEPAQWEELMGSIDETVRARLVQFFESRA